MFYNNAWEMQVNSQLENRPSEQRWHSFQHLLSTISSSNQSTIDHMPTLRQRPPKKGASASNLPSWKPSSQSATTCPPPAKMSEEPNTLTPLLHAKTDPEALSERHLPTSSRSEQRVLEQERLGQEDTAEMENLSRKSQWIVLALASGGCAAFNGVFAKL